MSSFDVRVQIAGAAEPHASRELPFQAEHPMMRSCPIINGAGTCKEMLELVHFGKLAPAFAERGWSSLDFLWGALYEEVFDDEVLSPPELDALRRMEDGQY